MADVVRRSWQPPPSPWKRGDSVSLKLANGGLAGPFTIINTIAPVHQAQRWRYEISDKHGNTRTVSRHVIHELSSARNTPTEIPEKFTSTTNAHSDNSTPPIPGRNPTINPILEANSSSPQFDSETVYSDTESLAGPNFLEYATAFGEEMTASLPSTYDKADFERISPFLDELLQTFALRINNDSSTEEDRSLAYLVHRYRRQITENLRQRYEDLAEDVNKGRTSGDEMTLEEKMARWANIGQDTDFERDNEADNIPEDDDEMIQLPRLEKYQEIIKQSSAYKWLIWKIGATDRTACSGTHDARESIRNRILESLKVEKQFKRGMSPRVAARYVVDWDPFEFHARQQYQCGVEQVLTQAITITGNGNSVQATTCLEYVEQTWGPSGVRLLRSLQEAIGRHSHPMQAFEAQSLIVEDSDINFSATYANGKFEVFASGIPYSVAEVGEILTWFATAMQSSAWDCAVLCNPTHNLQIEPFRYRYMTLRVRIDAKIKSEPEAFHYSKLDPDRPGSCWVHCFRNPVVVEGYPILRRSQAESGLEVSLDIMLSLSNAKYLVDFCQRTFLKGFSTMLAAMEVLDSTVFWHFFYNEDKNYISYEDARVPRIEENEVALTVAPSTLAKSRHILGWCKEVSCLAGTRDASYNIDWSGLLKPHSSCAFDKVSISAGKYVTVGGSLSIGIKDKAEHISFEDDYLSTLLMISERYFVLYDIDERRACLLDGISTLLHLLKAFIRYSQDDDLLQGFFILNEDDIQEDLGTTNRRQAAFRVLANEKNQRLPLWRKTTAPVEELTMKGNNTAEEALKLTNSYFCLRDRVLQICRLLQQTTAHHDDVHTRDGVGARIKRTPRRQLEGFDFMDIATHQGTLWPKVGEVHAWGEGWVDFTRELHCGTLFGTGFGELMKPVREPCDFCMSNVPQGPDLLAVTSADLQRIIKRKGDKKGKAGAPRRIIEDIFWYVPDKLFEDCTCNAENTKARSDRVQVFIPTSHPNVWGKSGQNLNLPEDGAILVGHSFKFPLRWGKDREPEKGKPETREKHAMILSRDSGIGSSRTSSVRAESEDSLRHRYGNVARHSLRESTAQRTPSPNTGIYLHPNEHFMADDYPSQSIKAGDIGALVDSDMGYEYTHASFAEPQRKEILSSKDNTKRAGKRRV